MSRWERWTTKPNTGLSLNKFMAEAPRSAAAMEAERQGLEFAGFAKYRDPSTGQIVARVVGDKLVPVQGDQGPGAFGTTAATTDTGNPTGAGYMGPADRAKQMGLQSDGSGGYIDPSTGEVVARTVNNELVFYSPMGGAVSDGAGGEQLTQPSPSWVDPMTGELMVPPAQPESPEEKAAVPDAVPALAPVSYNGFMNFKRKQMYAQQGTRDNIEADIEQKQAELDEMYSSNEGASAFKQMMDQKIQTALESEDTYKMQTAEIAQKMLEDNAQEYVQFFEMSSPDHHQELATELSRMVIKEAREKWFIDNIINPINNDDSLSDDEKLDMRTSERKNPQYGSHQFNGAGSHKGAINGIMDRRLGLDYTPNEPVTVEGEYVEYDIKDELNPRDLPGYRDLMKQSASVLKEYDVDQPTRITNVSWVSGHTDDPSENKKIALDALRTWRSKVLPSLEIGTVLRNDPIVGGRGGNQRERIYTLAGFGNYSKKYDGQYGVVVAGPDGKNTVVPIDDERKTKRLKEELLKVLDYQINNNNIDVIYETLFS